MWQQMKCNPKIAQESLVLNKKRSRNLENHVLSPEQKQIKQRKLCEEILNRYDGTSCYIFLSIESINWSIYELRGESE